MNQYVFSARQHRIIMCFARYTLSTVQSVHLSVRRTCASVKTVEVKVMKMLTMR